MSRLYRIARPEDYLHNPDTGLWELSFDQRPVIGTRAHSPQQGAAQYNAARDKFKAALALPREHIAPIVSFSQMTEWVIANGSVEQCQAVQQMFEARDQAEFDVAIRAGLQVLPAHLDFAYYFGRFSDRMRVPVSLREQLQSRLACG